MSVLVEAITVIFRNATADALIQGGLATIQNNPPNNTYRTDGCLSALGFMTPEDTNHYLEQLKGAGFKFIENGKAVDIAVCDQIRGFTSDCEWLETETDERGVRFCWMLGQALGEICTPDGWTFEASLYSTGTFRANDEPVDHLKFLRTKDGLNIYLDENIGKEVYVGRPFENKDDVHTVRTKSLLTATAVKVVYDAMLADGWVSISVKTEATAFPHLIMRFRNQIGILVLDVTWNGDTLCGFDQLTKDRLISKAESLKAIPLVAAFEISGEPGRSLVNIADVESCKSIQFNLIRQHLVHDISVGDEWDATNYDLEAKIELSNWEVHDFGIQVVRQLLEKDGHDVEHWNSDTGALSQIIAIIDGRLTHIVVQTVCYPAVEAEFDTHKIRLAVERAANRGADLKIASVSLASADDPFDSNSTHSLPIFRGAGVNPRFAGLENPKIVADS